MYDLLPIFRQLVDEFLKLKIRTELRKRARTYLARILGLPAWYGAVHFIASARFGESMTFWIGTTKRPRKLSTSFGLVYVRTGHHQATIRHCRKCASMTHYMALALTTPKWVQNVSMRPQIPET